MVSICIYGAINSAYMIDHGTFEKLNKCDWEVIILDLTLYAKRSLDILAYANVKIPLDKQPQDFAKEAIKLLYEGDRVWNQNDYPDVVVFLKNSVIDSLISNACNSPQVKRRAEAKVPANSGDSEEPLSVSDVLSSDEPNAEAELIAAEMETIAQAILLKVRKGVEDDDDCSIVLEELLKGSKPKKISEELGIPIEDVRNIVKKIKRKARKHD